MIINKILIILFILSLNCSKKSIVFESGSYLEGSFQLITELFFSEIYPEYSGKDEISAKKEYVKNNQQKAFSFIKEIESYSHLADRWNIREDKYYKDFLNKNHKSLIFRAALFQWKHIFGSEFSFDNLKPYYNMKIFYNELNKAIVKNKRKINKSNIDIPNFVIGSFNEKDLFFNTIKENLPEHAIKRLLAAEPETQKSIIEEALKNLLAKHEFKNLIKQYKANEDEIKRIAHYRVSKLYLTVKYIAHMKGVYPTLPIKIDFTKNELYDHFHKIMDNLRNIVKVKCRMAIVKDKDTSGFFFQELKKGGNFIKLAAQYSTNKKYLKKAYGFSISGYDLRLKTEKREKRSYFDKLILDAAQRKILNPKPYESKFGYIILQILDIKYSKNIPQYADYIWFVKNSLREELMSKQLEIDLTDIIRKLNFIFVPMKS